MRFAPALLAAAFLAAPVVAPLAPALADTLTADAAQRFVIGQTFSYSCYEGTVGAGRILKDGSVAGTIQMRGKGNTRYVTLPAGTLRVKGENVCAKLKGVAFEPCFELDKTSDRSFRGNLAGMDRMWCEFKRGGSGRTKLAERAARPKPTTTAQIDEGH